MDMLRKNKEKQGCLKYIFRGDERVFNNDKNIKVFALGVLGQAST